MILGIKSILKMVWFFIYDNWKVTLPFLGIFCILLFMLFSKSCNKPPKIDEKAIFEAQKAIAENDRKVMEKVLIDSDVKEKAIDDNLANAKIETIKAIEESKEKIRSMSNEELAKELERRLNQ